MDAYPQGLVIVEPPNLINASGQASTHESQRSRGAAASALTSKELIRDPMENGSNPIRSVRPSRYTEEDAQTVDKAKRIHKETTASAQRALKVCGCLTDIIAYLASSKSPRPSSSRRICSVDFALRLLFSNEGYSLKQTKQVLETQPASHLRLSLASLCRPQIELRN